MNVITGLLIGILAGVCFLAYWAVSRRQTGNATGGNAGGDPHALSADSADAVIARQRK